MHYLHPEAGSFETKTFLVATTSSMQIQKYLTYKYKTIGPEIPKGGPTTGVVEVMYALWPSPGQQLRNTAHLARESSGLSHT